MMNYVKVFCDCIETIDLLTDAEAGRLFKAILRYAGGQENQAELPGQEKLVFGMLRAQIDRDRASYAEKSAANRENGKKGGRPRKPSGFLKNPEKANGFFENPEKANKSEKSQDKDKDKDKDHPLCPPSVGLGGGGGGFLPEDEAEALMADHQAVYDLAARAGFPRDEMTLDKLTALIADYTSPWVLRAIDDANAQGKASIAYLRGILDRYRRQGRPEDTRPQRPPADRPEDAYLFPVPQEVRTDPGKVKFT